VWRRLSEYNRTNLSLWTILALQAGIINVGGFLACHRFVTHVTGFATQFGADLSETRWLDAAGMLAVPLFFLAGAMLSGFFIDRELLHSREPKYSLLALTLSLILFMVTFWGSSGSFGQFGDPHNIQANFLLMALLAFASGVQNAAVTSVSGTVIRTTHLTGVTTDLGIGLVKVFDCIHNKRVSATKELESLWIRLSLIGGFVLGSALGAYLFLHYGYWGFAVPTGISIALFGFSFRYPHPHHKKASHG
jgi:uncharacterized membrane protein YoaK (UPF0700 family)